MRLVRVTHGVDFVCVTFALCAVSVLSVPELKLLHVLFAHKLHAPREDYANGGLPQILSYEHFTSATMNMSNNANLNMYNLGVHLRGTYDEFLGDVYTPEIMKMRTTEHALSILTAQLVNAGLWPPSEKQTWMSGMNWQPIATEYLALKEDTLMLGSLCPNFISQTDRVLKTSEARETMSQHQALFDYLSRCTKLNITTPSEVALLYASLETMVDQNEILPHWANDVFPDGAMYNATLLEYDFLSATLIQRQLNGGTLLAEIIGNSLKYTIGEIPQNRKIMLYSGDERNIVGVLKNLHLWSPHILNEAASLIFELYFDNDTDTYGTKINYYTGTDDRTITLSLPNCAEICPLVILLDTIFDSISPNPQLLCGWTAVENSTRKEDVDLLTYNNNTTICNRSDSYSRRNLISNLLLIFIIINICYY